MNLASGLVSRLSEAIRNGSLQPGERLPTEQEMTVQFGISRTAVREAVAALKAEGLLSSRHGACVFVAASRPALSASTPRRSDGSTRSSR